MNRYWDERASKALKSGEPEFNWKRYVRSAFSLATEIGLSLVQSKKVNLLKMDLWNEGIDERQTGSIGKYQNRRNIRPCAIDISRVVCFQAKSKLKKVHITQATIENLPFKEEVFHIILDLSTSDHIPENKAINMLEEYRRVLTDKGILVLIFLHQNLRSKLHLRINRKYGKTISSRIQDSYLFSERIVESVKKNFDVLEHYYIGTFVSGRVLNKMPLRRFIVNLMLTLEYSKLSKYVLKNLGDFQVIIATKLEKSKT